MQRYLVDSPPRSDLHVHTHCSPDSSTSLDEACRTAVKNGLDAVAITDHVEAWEPMNPASPIQFHHAAVRTPDAYFAEIDEVRSRYKGRLRVIAGVEIGYQSSREDDIRAFLSGHPFEFVLGSIHDTHPVNMFDPASRQMLQERPEIAKKALTFYFTELRGAAESSLFDSISHIDMYERYFPRMWPNVFTDLELAPIVKSAVEAVAHHARMEINLLTLRTLKAFPWSALDLLKMYRQAGGKPPTIGSDSHTPMWIGRYVDQGGSFAKEAGFAGTADWHDVVRIV